MFKVKNNAITITRGDSGIAEISLQTAEGEEYTPQEGDSIRFALKSNRFTPRMTAFIDIEPLIEKAIPITDLNLRINPQDTQNLPFGSYLYDLEITFADGYVDTFVNCADFRIVPEVD